MHAYKLTTDATLAICLLFFAGCLTGAPPTDVSPTDTTGGENPADAIEPWDQNPTDPDPSAGGDGDEDSDEGDNENNDPDNAPNLTLQAIAYADAVIEYDPQHSGYSPQGDADARDPNAALGAPDYVDQNTQHATLGRGGLIAVRFVDNLLTNTGDEAPDLAVFEVDSDVEAATLAVRATAATRTVLETAGYTPTGEWFTVGAIAGGTVTVDLDATFTGFDAGALQFDGVRLIDNPDNGATGGITPGADIDAVGAISTVAT